MTTGNSKKFEKSCRLVLHEESGEVTELFDVEQRRFITAEEKRYILQENLVVETSRKYKTRKIYVCDVCLDKVKQIMSNPNKKPRQEVSSDDLKCSPAGQESPAVVTDETVTLVVKALTEGSLDMKHVKALSKAIGARIHRSFSETKSSSNVSRLDDLKTESYLDLWQQEPNQEWKEMLSHVCGIRNEFTASTARKLMKCTELVRTEVDQGFISNVALSEAILLLQFSHSKYAVDVFCRANAAGSFSTVRRTMALLGGTPFTLPDNDVILASDNNQVIQKTWMFKSEITKHQFSKSFPTAFFPSEANKPHILKRLSEFNESSRVICSTYRKAYIKSRLKKLLLECKVVDGSFKDNVCGPDVALNYDGTVDDIFKYDRVASENRQSIVSDMECLQENPNSFKAVAHVLNKILEYIGGSSGKRNYIPVYMDGAPFGLCMKLLRNQYVCSGCSAEIHADHKAAHVTESHAHDGSPKWTRKYKQIIIRPGSGHIEMTSVKAILSTFWIPFIKPVASILGYNSESQLQYCMKGYDHHKAYNLLMVVYVALSDELLIPYVQVELLNGKTPTYYGYCDWAREHEKKNLLYKLASDFCFSTLHSLNLLRCAIRQCNDEVSLSARHKLTSLLYSCNNFKYQEILCYDTCYLLSLPTDTRKIIGRESSRSWKGKVGEGYDFLLENRNKLYKSFLPTDSAPSFEQWLQLTKTANELEEIREVACRRLELNTKPSLQRPRKFEEEIAEARRLIRRNGFLSKLEHGFTAIDDESIIIDDYFQNYILMAEKNRTSYYEAYLSNEKTYLPIINTAVELQVSLCNDQELTDALQRKIGLLREPFYSFFKKAFKKSSPRSEKLDLYRAVMTQINCQQDAEYESSLSDAFKEYISIYN